MPNSKLLATSKTISNKRKNKNNLGEQTSLSITSFEHDLAFPNKISALQLFGNIFFSCAVCRRRKKKCDGQRPTCSSCIRYNLTCNYTTSYSDGVSQKDLELINGKIEKINTAIDYLEYNLTFPTPSSRLFSSELVLSSPPTKIQNFINVTIPQLIADENLTSNFSQQAISSLKNVSSKLDTLSTLSSASFIEIGYHKVDKAYLLKILKYMINSSSEFSTIFRYNFIKNKLLSGNISKIFIAALLAYASKFVEDSAVFKSSLIFSGSYYAKIAVDLLCQDVEDISVFRCLASLFIAGYQFFLGNLAQSFNFIEMAVKDSNILGLNKLDFVDQNYRENTPEWEELEFKRRAWWAIYAGTVYFGLASNRPAIIDDDYICVKLPRNDTYYRDGSTEVSIASFYNQLALKNLNQPISDCVWTYIRIIRAINRVSNFVNRRHLKRNSNPIKNAKTIDLLDSCISKIKHDYTLSFGDMPWNTLGKDSTIESPLNYNEICRYSLLLNCSFLFEFARLLLYRSELVHYSLDSESMQRAKKAKAICIQSALEFTNLLEWVLQNFSLDYIITIKSYLSFNVGIILCNVIHLTDHPQHQQIKDAYETILKTIKHFMKNRMVPVKYEKALQFICSIIKKTRAANEPYFHEFKELELAALTPMDLNPWAVPTGSSLSTEPCCCFNHNFPIIKRTLLSFWMKSPGILNSRFMNSNISHNTVN
ncbi:hypothetical protein BB560_004595 [Smittium megazygosporum]|uniref:Zn(2)-C6 fungal-type domain-containing protein n=1 Tax=Smittium megazygosporum TaxID=133381 RepID=A0A2T9Z8T8_9FUNG|nr:hypothetical protein BB560_004595 [Smittium megazygosporum]